MAINGYDPNTVAGYVHRIENLQQELAEFSAEIREQIKTVFLEALDEDSIPAKALKIVLKERALQARIDGLDQDDGQAVEHLLAALGQLEGTPLAEAAKTAAQEKGKKKAKPRAENADAAQA